MVAADTIFDEAPCSVDHLRATLDSGLLPTWQGMLLELHEDRVLPRPPALDLDTLLLVNHGVVKEIRNLCLVGTDCQCGDDVLPFNSAQAQVHGLPAGVQVLKDLGFPRFTIPAHYSHSMGLLSSAPDGEKLLSNVVSLASTSCRFAP